MTDDVMATQPLKMLAFAMCVSHAIAREEGRPLRTLQEIDTEFDNLIARGVIFYPGPYPFEDGGSFGIAMERLGYSWKGPSPTELEKWLPTLVEIVSLMLGEVVIASKITRPSVH